MSKKKSKPTEENQWHYQMPMGLFSSLRSRALLRRFEALSKYYFNYAVDTRPGSGLKPLEKLISDYDQEHQYEQLREAINKMIPLVYQNLKYLNAPTEMIRTDTNETFDIILDFFRIQDSEMQVRHELLMETLQRSIGIYDYVIERFWKWRIWQPTYWIATIINLPLRILSRSGLNVENEKTSNLYFWVVKSLMIVLLSLLIVKLGKAVNIVDILSKGLL